MMILAVASCAGLFHLRFVMENESTLGPELCGPTHADGNMFDVVN